MNDNSLEKLDLIIERTGVSYKEAKEALEFSMGDVVEAIIYIEERKKENPSPIFTSLEGFKTWLMELIDRGNISRIRIKKGEKVIVDVPVNAGLAAGFIGLLWTPIILIGIATATLVTLTVEITNNDGTVEVINTVVKNSAMDLGSKIKDVASEVKDKFINNKKNSTNNGFKDDVIMNDTPVYQYSVKFHDDEENK
ncbi:DUF4342 domain-containing protein [Clostridium hydrogeniformans]|uniref:DUF4342 domain-containing protein n=1 Tax=Clostridium hydrogeniformans TaxID=349933 RepID=UPI000480DC8F|nr:DUF4342 domain-containing protein [Clostridium hydrogeniformans]